MTWLKRCLVWLLYISSNFAIAQQQPTGNGQQLSAAELARVGGEIITVGEFRANLHAVIRQRYFHGKVSESELQSLRKEVAEELINRVILFRQAQQSGIKPDRDWIDLQIKKTVDRYASKDGWAEQRERLLASLEQQLTKDSLIRRLEDVVKSDVAVSNDEVRTFYDEHHEKFTTPEKIRISMILLAVEPWADKIIWDAAAEEAKKIIAKINNGTDFASLAKLHSSDQSAGNGGDLGFVHQGMLAKEAQMVLDKLQPGGLSGPVRLLKGIAIFRLEERVAPVLNDFMDVRGRAKGLLLREKKNSTWYAFVQDLREKTPVLVNENMISGNDGD
ncbi:MAG: peptidylprolyl isomerase [Gammaproteobacteria bacterium]